MSDKYIRALYTHCLVIRKEAALQDMQVVANILFLSTAVFVLLNTGFSLAGPYKHYLG